MPGSHRNTDCVLASTEYGIIWLRAAPMDPSDSRGYIAVVDPLYSTKTLAPI